MLTLKDTPIKLEAGDKEGKWCIKIYTEKEGAIVDWCHTARGNLPPAVSVPIRHTLSTPRRRSIRDQI